MATNLGRVRVVPRGTYSSTTSYEMLDIVTYEGSSYLVKTGCSGITPPNTAYYQLIASKGSRGEDGNDGTSYTYSWSGTTLTVTGSDGTTTSVDLKGERGDDGVSPKMEISEISGGHTVSVQDVTGTSSFNVMDGKDGISPTVTTVKTGKKTTVTVTDATGEKTFEISDGADGSGAGDMLKETYDPDGTGVVLYANQANTAGVANALGESVMIEQSKVNGLAEALSGKASTSHTHLKSEITDFSHTHSHSEISDFDSAVAEIIGESEPNISLPLSIAQGGTGASNADEARENIGAAALTHTHDYSDITGVPPTETVTITIDDALSSTSTNAIQNKVVKAALDAKASGDHTHAYSEVTGTPTLATVATSGSYNDLTGRPTIPDAITVDSALSSSSTNPVQNKVVYSALSGKANSSHSHTIAASDISGVLSVTKGGTGSNAVDLSPVSGSSKMVTSGGVYTALSDKADSGHSHEEYALSDHKHNYAGSSSAGGAATSADKVNSALTIQMNGTSWGSFNGSSAKTINITASNVGAAASGHEHSNYASSTHTHTGYASSTHSHSEYATSSHSHDASEITSGTLPVARGGTGNSSVDSSPTSGSSKMVTSGGVYTALENKSNTGHTHNYASSTHTHNGYVEGPSAGYKIACGKQTITTPNSNTPTSTTIDYSFSSTPTVVVTPYVTKTPINNNYITLAITSMSSTSCTVYATTSAAAASSLGTTTIQWIAIGT